MLRALMEPITKHSRLTKDDLSIYIIEDTSLNAFATINDTMAVFSGLIEATTAEGLLSVLAHEVGHLHERHITKMPKINFLPLAMSAVLTMMGLPVGTALIAAVDHLNFSYCMRYSREREASADRFALTVFQKNNWPTKETLKFMKAFSTHSKHHPYFLTHPIGRQRLLIMEDHLEDLFNVKDLDDLPNPPLPEEIRILCQRLKSKVTALLHPEKFLTISAGATDKVTLYSRAVAHMQLDDHLKSRAILEELLALNNSPIELCFLLQTYAGLLADMGEISKAIEYTEQALNASSHANPCLVMQRAILLLQQPTLCPEKAHAIIGMLEMNIATSRQKEFVFMAWHILAMLYGRLGKIVHAEYCLLEKFLLLCKRSARIVLTQLESKKDHPDYAELEVKIEDVRLCLEKIRVRVQ
ncbi:MAG: M48 family metalloprotease [Alphaproteobacteria bacterium]|nr:M48 family metalloprotease [Alphaproteobacteria bacterium]